jgi:biopolymer transport protein ExbD
VANKKRKDPTKGGKELEGAVEPDLTPMIDIVFQLVIFFLVANDLTRKEVEELKLPQAIYGQEDLAQEQERRIIINILGPQRDIHTGQELFPGRLPPKIPTIKVKGQTYDLQKLERFMRTQADLDREPPGGPGAPSAIYVLIRADKGTPWQHVQYVMQVCAQPNVAIYKMQFATTKRDDGKASTSADMGGGN